MTRVIQWATGVTGMMSLRHVIERADLELVGVRVYGPAKAGVDAGTLCGQSNLKKTRKRLQQAAKAMSKLVRRLNAKAARTMLDLTLRQTFIDAGTQVQTDVTTFRDAVACPQDAPS